MIARCGAVALISTLFLLATAPAASAHHADVSAAVSCRGSVSFTATAWRGASGAARTNPSIGVSYSTDGRVFIPLPRSAAQSFNRANGYTFSGSFELGRPLPQFVVVAARPLGAWGDRSKPGAARTTTRLLLPTCPSPTTRTTAPAGSANTDPVRQPSGTEHEPPPSGEARAKAEPFDAGRIMLVAGFATAGLATAGAWALRRALRG